MPSNSQLSRLKQEEYSSQSGTACLLASRLSCPGKTETDLDALFVEPATRRRGIGRLLVEHCASVAREHGSTALHVVGNPHAEAFYLACGFE